MPRSFERGRADFHSGAVGIEGLLINKGHTSLVCANDLQSFRPHPRRVHHRDREARVADKLQVLRQLGGG